MDSKIHNPKTFRALKNCSGADITLIERGDTIESEKTQIKNLVTAMIEKEKQRQNNWKKSLRHYATITKPLRSQVNGDHKEPE